jgi:alpha-galactosidase
LTTWLDPATPPFPVRAAEFRIKDEDPGYALYKNHVSAWLGAVELAEDDILLLGALDLGGRVELDGATQKSFYESAGRDSQGVPPDKWFLARGGENEVFSKYAELLAKKFGKGRFSKAPRVWCSWYSLYGWVNEQGNPVHAGITWSGNPLCLDVSHPEVLE